MESRRCTSSTRTGSQREQLIVVLRCVLLCGLIAWVVAQEPVVVDTATAVNAAPALAVNAAYRLYPGDLLRVQVYDHPDLSVDIRVPSNGRITFPLIGDLHHCVGLTSEQFVTLLKTRLENGYIKTAVITLAVWEFGPRRVYVMGSVARPGSFDLNPFAQLTAVQVIGQAGGFDEDANRGAAQVVRADPNDGGGRIALPVPSEDDAASLSRDVVLQPGDIVVVPRLDRVYISGRVLKPGAVKMPRDHQLTLSQALSLVGGFAKFAREDTVQLMRDGSVRVIDVRGILAGEAGDDPVLQPGDTVFVPESRF